MDPVRNPFAPGAGSRPPELAGRDKIISDALTSIRRAAIGRPARSLMLLGLRGVGKTVLLTEIESLAENEGAITSFVEAPENQRLALLLYPKIHQVLRRLSTIESAKQAGYGALRALRSFASAFSISVGDVSISVDPEPGTADSGILELDLTDLFLRVGETAKAAKRPWVLLIDEVQYLTTEELGALIVALHRCTQRNLPVLFFGAGLPQIAALSGDAKSYAERLFSYPHVGALGEPDARDAIKKPIADEGEDISEEAVADIIRHTHGYPYFLQEWGFQSWNHAATSPIEAEDVSSASSAALGRLDDGFFNVRYDRLTPKEKEYVYAMACLGPGPHRSSEVASKLGKKSQALGPIRQNIINKGMIYMPAHGDIAFTVPLFDEFLLRVHKAEATPP